MVRDLVRAVDRLTIHPQLGRASELTAGEEWRELVVGHLRVIYSVENELVIVARVWDTRRDPGGLSLA